jgi:anti-sigma B factor antagonist
MDEYRHHAPPVGSVAQHPVFSRVVGRCTLVELHGEIDIAVVPQLAEQLDAATEVAAPCVVVDLRAVTFLDCSGLGLLCRARRRAREHEGRLSLLCGDPAVLRLLRVTHLLRVFDLLEPPCRPECPVA